MIQMQTVDADRAGEKERELVVAGGREVAVSNPRKVLFPQAGYTKLDLAHYYLAVADGALRAAGGRPNVLVRYPNGIGGEFFYQKRAPASRPGVDRRRRRCGFRPAAARRKSCRATPRRWPGWPTSPASSCIRIRCAPTTSTIPTSCASISIRCPASPWTQVREVARVVHATLDDFGLIGWPKTSGSRGMHIYVRIERRWTFDRGAARRAGAGARGRAARARAGDQQMVEGGTPRRVPRLQPEREGPHGRQRLLGAPDARRARVGAAGLGRGRRRASPATSRSPRCRRDSPSVGDRHAGIDSAAGSLEALLELSARHEREGSGDAPWPPHYRKQPGEAAARGAVAPAHAEASPDRDRPRPQQGGRARRPRALEGSGILRPARHLEPADVLVDAMRGRFQTWTRVRVNLQHVPAELRPPQERARPR